MNAKQLAGEKATEYVKDGMTVGLRTGSTVYWTIQRLGQLVKEGLKIQGIPTSKRTEAMAHELKIPLTTFASVPELDLTIDGADEFDPNFNLIKGGGGALLREKLVAAASRQLIIVVDATKRVKTLGAFRLPVEIVPFAYEVTLRRIESLGCSPALRKTEGGNPYITDNANYIADCSCNVISDPAGLHQSLKMLPGVVETGLFIAMADTVIVAGEESIEVLERPKSAS